MTHKEHLIALRDDVAAGEWKHDGSAYRLFGDTWLHVLDAYNGDMNAALAFVAEVFPAGTTWQYYSGDGHCIVGYGPGPTDYDEAHHDTPARALLIAALNALIEETDE